MADPSVAAFMATAQTVRECLHAYGIHSATLQPELLLSSRREGEEGAPVVAAVVMVGGEGEGSSGGESGGEGAGEGGDRAAAAPCQIVCGKGMCGHLMCCHALVQG